MIYLARKFKGQRMLIADVVSITAFHNHLRLDMTIPEQTIDLLSFGPSLHHIFHTLKSNLMEQFELDSTRKRVD